MGLRRRRPVMSGPAARDTANTEYMGQPYQGEVAYELSATSWCSGRRRPCSGSPGGALSASAAAVVRAAISASGGLGEPWCVDGSNAVRVGNLLLVVEVDDLGWIVTGYAVAGGQAVAVAVLSEENEDPVRALSDWLRSAAGPMAWRRVEPGLYRCGGYLVGQLDTGEWFAEGPGVDRCFDRKHAAQAACAAARTHTTPQPGRLDATRCRRTSSHRGTRR